MSETIDTNHIERENVRDNYDDGIFIWKDIDDNIIGKAEIDDKKGIDLTFRKGELSNLEERMKELNQGPNMQNEEIESDNPDYVKYHIRPAHNWNLAKRDIITTIDHWFNPIKFPDR